MSYLCVTINCSSKVLGSKCSITTLLTIEGFLYLICPHLEGKLQSGRNSMILHIKQVNNNKECWTLLRTTSSRYKSSQYIHFSLAVQYWRQGLSVFDRESSLIFLQRAIIVYFCDSLIKKGKFKKKKSRKGIGSVKELNIPKAYFLGSLKW